MNNKLDNEYKDSEISVNENLGDSDLPEELCEPGMIDWIQDGIDVYDFHNDEEFWIL